MKQLTLLFLCLLGLLGTSTLQAEHYFFTRIALKAGLPSTLNCIFHDSKGYIWTGTRAGLGRFDGHEQRRYLHEEGDPSTLPGNFIHQIAEDSKGNLWILTDQGTAAYDYDQNHFHRLYDQNDEPVEAYACCPYRGGILLVSAEAIFFLPANEMRATKWFDLPAEEELRIVRIALLPDNRLLIGTRWKGVYAMDLSNGKLQQAPYTCGPEITDLLLDSHQRLWIATYNEGVRCFQLDGKLLHEYRTENSLMSHNIVLCMAQHLGKIWMGTDGGGINILDPETQQFTHIFHTAGKKQYSLPTNSINCLYHDSYGNLWMGGVYNGLIALSKVSMRSYTDDFPGSHQGLSHPVVLSLYQQPGDSALYIGTDGGGLNRLDPATGLFQDYPTTEGMKVASICSFGPDHLLLSVFSKGLFLFHPSTGKLSPFMLINEETTQRLCMHGHAVNLFQESPESILFLADHVYRYRIGGGNGREEPKGSNKREGETGIHGPWSNVREEKPVYWGSLMAVAATEESVYLHDMRRIYQLDRSSDLLKVVFTCNKEQSINSVTRDKKGNFWMGTNRGLICFHEANGQVSTLTSTLYNEISSIACDKQGRLWIGADNSLFSYHPEEQRLVIYGESDGVLPNEYRSKSKWLDGKGNLFMGGVQGLVHINTLLVEDLTDNPTIQLSDVLLNGESNKELSNPDRNEMEIPYGTNISVRFMARERDIFRKRIYRYTVDGLSQEPIITQQPSINLRALLKGTYRIQASCNTKEGEWTPYSPLLTLHVLPPWYQSWWFVLGCALTVTLTILLLFQRYIRKKEESMRWAMKEHEQQVYEQKVRFLINVSHELRTPLTLIYAPLKRILQEMAQDDKHYLPLKAIYRQSQRMKDVINMVLDVRKMEVGEGKLHIQPHRLNEWMVQYAKDFAYEAAAEGIEMTFDLDERIEEVSFDKGKGEIILSNLLMNALKHSPKGGRIVLSSRIVTDGWWVRVAVKDGGKGLQHVNDKKLFTRFYQGEGEQQGTGIGLSYCKILVEQHQGTMGAYNNPDGGATFYFEIPLRQLSEEWTCTQRPYLNELISEESDETPIKDEEFDATPFTILVADDNSELTQFLKESLTPYFKRVLVAADGQEALQMAQSYLPDIVISDVMMPRMNGFQLCQKMKEKLETSHIPIILLTAREDSLSETSGYKTGADGYLSKPFELDTLVALIKSKLKNRENMRRRYLNAGNVPLPEENTYSLADESFLLKINGIIHEHLAEDNLDVTLLCKELAVSRASLYQKMKALTGLGANEYINKLRLEKAMELIANTSLAFSEIADQVGFTTPSYFSTAFKQYTGLTPTQYKKKVNEKAP